MSGHYFKHVENEVEIFVWSPRGGAEIEIYDPKKDEDEYGSVSIVIPKDKISQFIEAIQKAAKDAL